MTEPVPRVEMVFEGYQAPHGFEQPFRVVIGGDSEQDCLHTFCLNMQLAVRLGMPARLGSFSRLVPLKHDDSFHEPDWANP